MQLLALVLFVLVFSSTHTFPIRYASGTEGLGPWIMPYGRLKLAKNVWESTGGGKGGD
jgi:hypothetical protein